MFEMEREDDLSSASFVSTISAVSSIHQPRPPDVPKPATRGFRAKRQKVVRSPYLAAAVATSTPHSSSQRRPSGWAAHKVAPSFSKAKWGHVLRTAGFTPSAWSSPPPPPAPALLETVIKTAAFPQRDGAKKRKRSQSTTGVQAASAQDSVDAIALRDEVLRLKAALRECCEERELFRAQHRRLEHEADRKDRHITDLLAAGHITSGDATRSLAGGKAVSEGGGAVISSLRQQVHGLERALREREAAVSELKRSQTASRLREAQLHADTYYRELCRLTVLLEQQQPPSSVDPPHPPLREAGGVKAVGKLGRQLEDRQALNARLKQQQLASSSSSSPTGHDLSGGHCESDARGSIADQYLDLNRSQLLSAIVDLQLCVAERDVTVQSLCREQEQQRARYEGRIAALTGQHSDAQARTKELQASVLKLEQTQGKLRSVVRKLKEDRLHYRSIADSTQAEMAEVSSRLLSEEAGRSGAEVELGALRESHDKEMLAAHHARQLAASHKSQVLTPDKEKRQQAAGVIQQQWKRRRAINRQQKFQEKTERAVVDIQCYLQGHLSRKTLLQQQTAEEHAGSQLQSIPSSDGVDGMSDSSSGDESSAIIEDIQSAIRGHFTREMALRDFKSTSDVQHLRVSKPASIEGSGSTDPFFNSRLGSGTRPTKSSLVCYKPPVKVTLQQTDETEAPYSATAKRRVFSSSPWSGAQQSGSDAERDSCGEGPQRSLPSVLAMLSSGNDSSASLSPPRPNLSCSGDELT